MDPYKPPEANLKEQRSPFDEKLSIKRVLLASLAVFIQKRTALAKALLITFIVLLALEYSYVLHKNYITYLILEIFNLAVYTLFAVITHRLVLLPESETPNWGIIKWSQREWSFFLYLIIAGICLIPAALIVFIPKIGPILSIVVSIWITARLCLVFPSIAVDKKMSLGQSWKETEIHQLPLMIIAIAFPLILGIPIFLLEGLFPNNPIVSIIGLIMTILTIVSVSLAYHEIKRINRFGIEANDN